ARRRQSRSDRPGHRPEVGPAFPASPYVAEAKARWPPKDRRIPMAQPWLHLMTRDPLYWYCTVPIFEMVPKPPECDAGAKAPKDFERFAPVSGEPGVRNSNQSGSPQEISH